MQTTKKKPLFFSGMSPMARKDAMYGYIFILPLMIGFVIFVAIPLVNSFLFSLNEFNSLSGRSTFVGVDNYIDLANSPTFQTVIWNTVVFSLGVIPGNILLGLLLAILMNQKFKGIAFFRTAYFVPAVISLVAWSLVWEYLLQNRGGVNAWLSIIGITGPNWLNDDSWSMIAVIIVQILKGVGISAVLFLAALQDIPQELQEAVKLDGASKWQSFWHLTRPLISPTMFMVAILATINSLKAFAQIYLLTYGGPGLSTTTLGFYVYEQAFKSFQVGYASAAAIILFCIILGLTLFQWWTRKRWVYNES